MEVDSLKKQLLDYHRTLGWMDLVIANIDDGVCVIAADGALIFVNDAFAKLAGQQRIFLLGKKFWDVINLYQGDEPLSKRLSRNPSLVHKTKRLEGMYALKSTGTTYYVALSASHLDTVDQTVLLFRDTTGQRELDMMKSKFISLTSHQLRTPLSVMNVYINMLKDGYEGQLNEGQQELISNVLNGLGQMRQLVTNLLNTGRVEQGRIRLSKEPLDMNALLSKVVSDIRPRLDEKNILLTMKSPRTLPPIVSDPQQLREIISNVIINAVQYSQANSDIIISIAVHAKENRMVVAVRDHGIGIPKESQSQIFMPFYRADNAILHYTSGTGLGLYAVKLLVGELDGTIDFKSSTKGGTTFFIRLPLYK